MKTNKKNKRVLRSCLCYSVDEKHKGNSKDVAHKIIFWPESDIMEYRTGLFLLLSRQVHPKKKEKEENKKER
jgi:hypothetical protein